MSRAAHELARSPRHILNAASQEARAARHGPLRRAASVDDLSVAVSAPAVQLAALDGAVADVHVAVADANADIYGDPVPPNIVQLKAARARGGSDDDVRAAAARGVSGPAGALPQLARVQAAFGRHDLSGLKAHVGGRATEAAHAMGARAYASGAHVAFAASPDLHTEAHEAAHFVQQRAGVVAGGVGKVGDAHERHADAVADAVVGGRSAEGLLDRVAGPAGGGPASAVQRAQAPAVQRAAAPAVRTNAGTESAFEVEVSVPIYGPLKFVGKVSGTFSQKEGTDGKKSELEGVVSGTIVCDLVLAKLQIGLEGKLKLSMDGFQGPAAVLKEGLAEVARWQLARDFSQKLGKARADVAQAIAAAREKAKDLLGQLDAAADRGFLGPLLNGFSSIVIGLHVGVVQALRPIGATQQNDLPFVQRAGAIIGGLTKIDDTWLAASDTKGREKKKLSLKAGVAQLRKTFNDGLNEGQKSLGSVLAAAGAPTNRPNVGFEGSLALKVGAGLQVSPKAGVEVEGGKAVSIKDGDGKAFDHSAQQALVFAVKLTFGELEVQVAADMKATETEVTLGFTAKKSVIAPEDASFTLEQLAGALRQLHTMAGFSGMSLAALTSGAKNAASIVSGKVQLALSQAKTPQTIALRKKGASNQAASTGVEVKLKLGQGGTLKGGTVKIVPAQVQVSAEKALGPVADKAVKGTFKTGGAVELSWGAK